MLIFTFSVFILHTVVDVSAQGACTITAVNPTTLTAAGGVLANGTENVTIRCNCTDGNGIVVDPVRWYYPTGSKVRHSTRVSPGQPYRRKDPDEANVLLLIPTFSDFYDGIYTCGMNVARGLPGPPIAAVNLTIGGK